MYKIASNYSKVRLIFYTYGPDFGYLEVKIWISKYDVAIFFHNYVGIHNSNFKHWLFDLSVSNFLVVFMTSKFNSLISKTGCHQSNF